jgi:hypothetical protein
MPAPGFGRNLKRDSDSRGNNTQRVNDYADDQPDHDKNLAEANWLMPRCAAFSLAKMGCARFDCCSRQRPARERVHRLVLEFDEPGHEAAPRLDGIHRQTARVWARPNLPSRIIAAHSTRGINQPGRHRPIGPVRQPRRAHKRCNQPGWQQGRSSMPQPDRIKPNHREVQALSSNATCISCAPISV